MNLGLLRTFHSFVVGALWRVRNVLRRINTWGITGAGIIGLLGLIIGLVSLRGGGDKDLRQALDQGMSETARLLTEIKREIKSQKEPWGGVEWEHSDYLVKEGYRYFKGDEEVPVDYKRAMRMWLAAANKGQGEAQFNVGLMYQLGLLGEKDDESARFWYERSAAQGFAPAQVNLASLLCGVSKDKFAVARSVELCTLAAEQGNAIAQYNLANMFYFGVGVNRDYGRFLVWCKKSARQGLSSAQCDLAAAYLMGYGTDRNEKLGVLWLRRAVESGSVRAMIGLSSLSFTGVLGVKRDWVLAYQLAQKAVDMNELPMANSLLGVYYYFGFGCEPDVNRAKLLLKKASLAGETSAKAFLKAVENYESSRRNNRNR